METKVSTAGDSKPGSAAPIYTVDTDRGGQDGQSDTTRC